MSEFNHDQELERRYHPENFDGSIAEAEREAEGKERQEDLKKQLFKDLYGTMIDEKYCELPDEEVAKIALGVLTLFKNKYLGYAKGIDLEQLQ